MIACDTNIYVYALSEDDPARRARAVSLLSSLTKADAVMLWQVACEFAAVVTRTHRRRAVPPEAFDVMRALRGRFPLVLPSPHVLDRALDIHREDQVSFWDALLLAACLDAGVTRLYTQDRQSAPIIRGIEIVNPFSA